MGETLVARCKKEFKEEVEKVAEKRNLSLSQFIRIAVYNEMKDKGAPVLRENEKELAEFLNKVMDKKESKDSDEIMWYLKKLVLSAKKGELILTDFTLEQIQEYGYFMLCYEDTKEYDKPFNKKAEL